MLVVYRLEVVEVGEEQGEARAHASGPLNLLVEAYLEATPAGDAGQAVYLGLPLQVLSALPLVRRLAS